MSVSCKGAGEAGDSGEQLAELPPKPDASAALATGGDIDFIADGIYWDEVHTFEYKGSGDQTDYNFEFNETPAAPIPAQLLVVAGGGAGGSNANQSSNWAGGGGAGGVIYYGSESPGGNYSAHGVSYPLSQVLYAVKVGRGGAETNWATPGENGQKSTFGNMDAWGGGGGAGAAAAVPCAGVEGGSGGGALEAAALGGAGTSNQGNKGADTSAGRAGGGGGAGGAAPNNTGVAQPGNGGAGIELAISGTLKGYAGGGASGRQYAALGVATHGGGGSGTPGEDGTGGGGSGSAAGTNAYKGQPGGSGIVIVRFRWTAP